MKIIKTATITLLFSTIISHAQQIGEGYAPATIADFSAPLSSGIYNGLNTTTIGMVNDNSNVWQHLFVARHTSTVNNYQLQIASSFTVNDRLFFRKIATGTLSSSNTIWIEFATRTNNTFNGNQIVNGTVGIGTTTPNSLTALDVNGRAAVRSIFYVNDVMGGNGGDIRIGPNTGGPSSTVFMIGGIDASEVMRINYNKNVGIGTAIPDEKLTVKGKIHTQEVRVDMSGPLVPDYVFAEDYKLKSLQEVEDYIKENKHLPEIPSAQEIEKNGLMLAEMNMSLLKKIEEMTLYMIEMKKENEKQNEIIKNNEIVLKKIIQKNEIK